MVYTHTRYVCEICGNHFVEEHNAHRCEAQGLAAIPGPHQLPLLFGNHHDADDRWSCITFVLLSVKRNGHHAADPLAWAARDNGAGDNGYCVHDGQETNRAPWWLECCPGDWWNAQSYGQLDPSAPHFQRAVEFCRTFLRRHDSEIHVRVGRRIVTLAELQD